jgi:hypothetical protein
VNGCIWPTTTVVPLGATETVTGVGMLLPPPPQPAKMQMVEEQNSIRSLRVMNDPWREVTSLN